MSTTNLTQASTQWASRPDDERFWDLEELFNKTSDYRERSVQTQLKIKDCHLVAHEDTLKLRNPAGSRLAEFTHFSFGQLSRMAGAPSEYLRTLPPQLAAQNLNQSLSTATLPSQQTLLLRNGSHPLQLQAITTDKYQRLWNNQVAHWLLSIGPHWQPPPSWPVGPSYQGRTRTVTEAQVHASSIVKLRPGDIIAPSGIYASDHDMFCFLIHNDRHYDVGSGETLGKGFFVQNSEVGDCSFKLVLFYFDYVCGNHIVWGARGVTEFSSRHIGEKFFQKVARLYQEIEKATETTSDEDLARLRRTKNILIADKPEDVIEFVADRTTLPVSFVRRGHEIATLTADSHHASPNSVWGMFSGLTRASQVGQADKRDRYDRLSAKLLSIDF